jgi:hypothetical protein
VVTPNSFFEDTSVLVAVAFVLVRGPVQKFVSSPLHFGLLTGVLGASESFFPDERFPYAPHTIACALATSVGGIRAGLVTAVLSTVSAFLLLKGVDSYSIAVQVSLTLAAFTAANKWLRPVHYPVGPAAILVGCIGSFFGVLASRMFFPSPYGSLNSFVSVPANAFALLLLSLVLRDANLRSESERKDREAQEALRLAAEANLAALRARVQPHFLFNALNSIAALCTIAPEEASKATVQLGSLMRRSLETDPRTGILLKEEMEAVRNYLAIERRRFGSKLRVRIDVVDCEDMIVPAFSVQTLVENAILHGISRKTSGGEVAIVARKNRDRYMVVVMDEGVGVNPASLVKAETHGLGLLSAQLKGKHGNRAHFHILPRPSGGTLAVFGIPLEKRDRK